MQHHQSRSAWNTKLFGQLPAAKLIIVNRDKFDHLTIGRVFLQKPSQRSFLGGAGGALFGGVIDEYGLTFR